MTGRLDRGATEGTSRAAIDGATVGDRLLAWLAVRLAAARAGAIRDRRGRCAGRSRRTSTARTSRTGSGKARCSRWPAGAAIARPPTTGRPTPRTPAPTGTTRTTPISAPATCRASRSAGSWPTAHAAGASVIVTVPILGYVAADKLGDGDVAQTPDYLHRRFCASLPRKGRRSTSRPSCATRRSIRTSSSHWLEATFPESRRDPARTIFYALDNEPDLWPSTHARIHPDKTRYDEIVRLNVDVCRGDQGRRAHGAGVRAGELRLARLQHAARRARRRSGRDFLEFYLRRRCAQAEEQCGPAAARRARLHWYPEAQGGGVRITEDDAAAGRGGRAGAGPALAVGPRATSRTVGSPTTRTRGPIRLLPRLREKIDKHYPRHAPGDHRILLRRRRRHLRRLGPGRRAGHLRPRRGVCRRAVAPAARPTIASSTPPSPCSATTTATAALRRRRPGGQDQRRRADLGLREPGPSASGWCWWR